MERDDLLNLYRGCISMMRNIRVLLALPEGKCGTTKPCPVCGKFSEQDAEIHKIADEVFARA